MVMFRVDPSPASADGDLFRLLIESITDYAIFLLDPHGAIGSWNAGAERIEGYTAAQVLGQPFAMLFTPQQVAEGMPRRVLQAALERGHHEEEAVRVRRNGERFWALCTVMPLRRDDTLVAFAVVFRDIEHRKRGYEQLQAAHDQAREANRHAEESLSLLRALLDHMPAEIAFLDRQFRYVHANRPLAAHSTLTAEEHLGRTVAEVVPDIWPKIEPLLRRVRDQGEAMLGLEVSEPSRARGGRIGHWLSNFFPVRDAAGTIFGVGVLGIDVSEQKQMEQELRRSETRYRSLVTATAEVVWTADPQGQLQQTHGGARFTGSVDAQRPAEWWQSITHPDDQPRLAACWAEAVRQRAALEAPVRLRQADGSWRHMLARAVPLLDPAGQVEEWVGVTIDITDRVLAEQVAQQAAERLQQAQKLEAVGRLAGGIAHDFNNLLTVINSYAELLLASSDAGELHRASLASIRDAGERAAQLTGQLLAFSRQAVIEPRLLDLNQAVSRADQVLRRLLGEDVVLVTRLAPSLPRIQMDPGQLEQALLNLAVNARDAMSAGGRLLLETSLVELADSTAARCPDCKPGSYVCLTVSDTGCGMTREVQAHAFEPFFTTKEVGQGTGLGLAMVYGIVTRFGGSVAVTSKVDVGTTFTILLPAAEAVPASPCDRPHHGNETVLLVEDEETVRRLARIILETRGYRVLAAADGAEALRLASLHEGSIQLLLTDVVMPGMGGRQVADILRARLPGLKVLFMSGYTSDETLRHGIAEGRDPFLQKPFTPISLVEAVRGVLELT